MSALADELGGQDALRPACGLPLSTYFSGVKLRWLLETVPAVKEPRSGISPHICPRISPHLAARSLGAGDVLLVPPN